MIALAASLAMSICAAGAPQGAVPRIRVADRPNPSPGEVSLVSGNTTADIYVDSGDFEVVKIAARLLADDLEFTLPTAAPWATV
jgi:hypothetical protein